MSFWNTEKAKEKDSRKSRRGVVSNWEKEQQQQSNISKGCGSQISSLKGAYKTHPIASGSV